MYPCRGWMQAGTWAVTWAAAWRAARLGGPMVALVTTAYGLCRGVARLPDTDPSCRFEPQLVGSADVKRAVELVEVAHDLVATELAG